MKTNVEWLSSWAEMDDTFRHPGLRLARFIFCDDKPNENQQGIEYEDFPAIAKSAVGTPVKAKFMKKDVEGHFGSIPIGHITEMTENELEDGTHQLIANAILYADDYPDEVEFLQKTFSEGKAPGISWELSFSSKLLKDGVEWLKGIITRAATFVRSPAYGSRTALLALASNQTISADDFMTELAALVDTPQPKLKEQENEGGNNVTVEELQAELDKIRGQLTEVETAKAGLETEKVSLETENTSLKTTVSEQGAKIAEFTKKELVAIRSKALVEAGMKIDSDPEKLEKAFWISLEDSAFAEYVESIKEMKPAKAVASKLPAGRMELPRYSGKEEGGESDIRLRIRSLRNQPVVTAE